MTVRVGKATVHVIVNQRHFVVQIEPQSGLLADVPFLSSPHCDARPEGVQPELIVVHGITLPPGEFGGPWIDDLFMGRLDPGAHPYFAEIAHLRVSAHLLIRRDGSVTQYVPFNQRAWHAGTSSFDGRDRCNDFSIGIELEGTDDIPYTVAQYDRLAEVIHALHGMYPTLKSIAGHEHIAPGRKTDQGPAFDWGHLERALNRETLFAVSPRNWAFGARLVIMSA